MARTRAHAPAAATKPDILDRGAAAIVKELGLDDAVAFLARLAPDRGVYDRAWAKRATMEEILAEIRRGRRRRPARTPRSRG
jgi:hypothetical protein